MPTTVVLDGYVDLGTESHPLAADSNFKTFKEVFDYEGCMKICKRNDCTWGSFIARKQTHLNSCVIATSAPKADANGKLLTRACPTDEECHSFSASRDPFAVDMLNSRAFVKASDKPSDYKPSKEGQIHYEKCQWAEGRCSAVDRSGKPGLTGIHKTIPNASVKWCKARMAMGDYVEWSKLLKVCMYGCGVIRTEDTCEKAEDHFKMMNGANPCTDGEYWDDASETCASCKSMFEYQPSSAHFLRTCNKCPVKSPLGLYHECKTDCQGFNSVCSKEKECGTLVSPELEAHCLKHPEDCTVDYGAAMKCTAYCHQHCSIATPA